MLDKDIQDTPTPTLSQTPKGGYERDTWLGRLLVRIVLSQNTFPAKTRLRVVCMAGVADAASKTKKKAEEIECKQTNNSCRKPFETLATNAPRPRVCYR